MKSGVFKLFAEIIELTKKPVVPIGEMTTNVAGETYEIDESDYGKSAYRAILDIGLLDISTDHLIPDDSQIEITDASSDMLIADLGATRRSYKVGDLISFKLTYMGALAVLNSNYIDKEVK
jgi:predicted amino acid racemase